MFDAIQPNNTLLSRKKMITPELLLEEPRYNPISYSQLYSDHIQTFMKPFEHLHLDEERGLPLEWFDIRERKAKQKINSILKVAKPSDAQEIVTITNEVYEGTYPYLEMLDVNAVREKIEGPNYVWFLFKDRNDNTMGIFKFYLDFEQKKGYLGGFCVKKQYQGKIDSTKCQIGMLVWMVKKYGDRILVWYCENRTAHAATQYMVLLCGLRPVGFYPNKDVFYGKVESDLLQVAYDRKALKEYRSKTTPNLIPQIAPIYFYSNAIYDLGLAEFKDVKIALDPNLIKTKKENLNISIKIDEYGYEKIRFFFRDTGSYFRFLHTPTVKNFEKTEYQVNSLEELCVFIQMFKSFVKALDIRYFEVFVSAYKPYHQKLFFENELMPRGYVPSWNYDELKEEFEDAVLFSHNEGKINEDIQLIDDAWKLMDILDI